MERVKVAVDVISVGVVISTLASWLPPVAALFTVLWAAMQMVMNYRKFIFEIVRIYDRRKTRPKK